MRISPSPATHVPTTPAPDVTVALVISGSPGSNDHAEIHRLGPRASALFAPGGTEISGVPAFRLKAEATGLEAEATGLEAEATGLEAEATGLEGVPRGNPPSTHETISAISSGVSEGSLLNAPKPRAACHFGMRRASTWSLIARAQGRTSSYVVSGI